jgi:hypothetical protein
MELLSTIINAAVVGTVGILFAWFSKGRFDRLEQRMERLEERFDRMRSDLTQVALAVGVRPQANNR